MMHLGDITKIKGSEAPPVDVIIGGSPSQENTMRLIEIIEGRRFHKLSQSV